MGQKVILDVEDLTALADAARANTGDTSLYSLAELTAEISRATALPGNGTAGQFITMGADGRPAWTDFVSNNIFLSEIKAGIQTPGTALLRNSKLVSTETTPTVNGEIYWKYE